MNMGGMGTKMMKKVMKDKNVDSLEELMKQEIFTTEINPQYEELKEFLLKK